MNLSIKLQHQDLLRLWTGLFCILFVCESFFLFGESLVGICCFLLVWGLLFFLKMPMQLGLQKNSGAGSFKVPTKLERLNLSEFTFYSVLITEPLLASLVTSNTHC